MTVLHIDIETYSSLILPEVGVYAYSAAPDFRILLFGYAYNDEPVRVLDLACGETLPEKLVQDIKSPRVTKMAHNAQFERVCLSALLRTMLEPESWYCTAAHAAMLGLPMKLAQATKLVLPLEHQKSGAGTTLIKYFCGPCAGTAKNSWRTRNLPAHAPAEWAAFKAYCGQDVVAERELERALAWYEVPAFERRLYALDQQINDRGVLLDPELVYAAIKCDNLHKDQLIQEALELAGITNAKSAAQVKAWLNVLAGEDEQVVSLTKESMPALLKGADNATTRRVLEIRQELAKTSVIKYQAMARAIGPDNRVRGLLMYYGANRTGRWSGRLVQVQNLPQNHMNDLGLCRAMVKRGDFDGVETLFGSISQALSELIRTAFVPRPGTRFVVADFSAIEARVIAWWAGESWRMDVFRTHGKIYEASASAMFKVPIATITKGHPLRQRGKIAELALGFGGSVGALEKMGAVKMGVPANELKPLVNAWRRANPKIVQLWADVEDAAMEAVETRVLQRVGPVTFELGNNNTLLITLPSGRQLAYQNIRIETDTRWNKPSLFYDGTLSGSKGWGKVTTYGGKLTENVVQAVARDCLAEALVRLDNAGYRIVMHVHDEAVLEVPREQTDAVDSACDIMGQTLSWAPDLPLCAAGFECEFYQKD